MAFLQRRFEHFVRHQLASWSCGHPRVEGNVQGQLVNTAVLWQCGYHSRAAPYSAPEAAEVAGFVALPQRLVEYFARHLLVSWSCRRPRGEGNV